MDNFWWGMLMFILFIPLIFLWGFTLFDLFARRDLAGWAKASWAIGILFLPIIGMLVYFLVRPREFDYFEARDPYALSNAPPLPDTNPTPAQQLESLARMHDNGQLSDEEFARLKQNLVA